jgi:phosphoadenosine phosphosulfate reductase
MVVLHLARRLEPRIPVLFLETGYHFAATYSYRDRMAAEWDLNLINLSAALSVRDQESQFGVLNQTDPSRCCAIRKVEPLMAALDHYDVWLTGLRREQSPTRASLAEVEPQRLPSGHLIRKVNPLAAWKWTEVWSYLAVHEIPYLPLYDEGYTSIGCEPCTAKPFDAANPRSGRWGGRKLECGIHVVAERT